MNEIKLTPEQKNFLIEVLEPMLEAYKQEAKDFENEDYYAENEMKNTKDILNQLNKYICQKLKYLWIK